MGADTKIEWADHTFNPWVGCAKVSPACDHCYAEAWAKRTGQSDLWAGNRRRTSTANWKAPLKWNRDALAAGTRPRVFCASLADVFDNQVPDDWRDDLWHLIASTGWLDWLLLTKRPQNIAKMLPPSWGTGYPNVWLGTTVENQDEADRRIPHLMSVPAAVRFLSCEPLLGPLDLYNGDPDPRLGGHQGTKTYIGDWWEHDDPRNAPSRHGVDWVIAGGESGPSARSTHPDWIRSLRDQCNATDVPFFFKQWGEWRPSTSEEASGNPRSGWMPIASRIGRIVRREELYPEAGAAFVENVGRARAGRLLDGRTWDEMPEARR